LSKTFAALSTVKTQQTFSVWCKRGSLSAEYRCLFGAYDGSSTYSFALQFASDHTLQFEFGTSSIYGLYTTQVFRDPSAWYHIVLAIDTTQATASNRVKMYVNGVQVTSFSTANYPPQNANSQFPQSSASAWSNKIASTFSTGGSNFYDGYLTEINFIDGQALTPSSFGSTNALTGVWQPARYAGTYGTNGFYLPFTDNSALTTSSNVGLGKDFSGNGNYWVTNNISITTGVTYDSMTDVPTLTSATAANFCTWNPLLNSSYTTLSNGNLTSVGNTSTDNGLNVGTIGVSSGKWYWEATVQGVNSTGTYPRIGFLCNIPASGNGSLTGLTATLGVRYNANGDLVKNANVLVGTYATFTTNDVISFALDVDNLTCGVYKNNTLQTTITGLTMNNQFFAGNGAYDGGNMSANFGQRPFVYTPPTGYLAINTYNLPASTIVKGNTVMDATLWAGNGGASQTVANAGSFKPDLVWMKTRNQAYGHLLFDSVRGTSLYLQSNGTGAEVTDTTMLSSFNSNGFTVGSSGFTNGSGNTEVGWQWQAGQGSSSSNTNGTITSTVSVNASAGFSVVTYTGTGANATIGHGLGVAPSFYVVKQRNGAASWLAYHASIPSAASQYLVLDLTNAVASNAGVWNNTAPTSSVFSIGTVFAAGTYVAYCWTPIAGFSAFGSYTGNGSTDGPFVYTGFRPRWILIKRTDTTEDWYLYDTARNTYNLSNLVLFPDLSIAETTGITAVLDSLSNGFKFRNSGNGVNASGGTYVYMAFAETPTKFSLAR
jgi:hypothetical protein